MLSDDPLVETLQGLVHIWRQQDTLILHPGAPSCPRGYPGSEIVTQASAPVIAVVIVIVIVIADNSH